MVEDFTVTDSTTREELIARVNYLEEENTKLEDKVEDQQQKLDDLRLVPEQTARLYEAASLMAELGRIHNTPYAKAAWARGE